MQSKKTLRNAAKDTRRIIDSEKKEDLRYETQWLLLQGALVT
jgi:hypothetical protein